MAELSGCDREHVGGKNSHTWPFTENVCCPLLWMAGVWRAPVLPYPPQWLSPAAGRFIPALLLLQSQTLTAADTVNMSVMCQEGKRWSMVMSQAFKPFENREWGSQRGAGAGLGPPFPAFPSGILPALVCLPTNFHIHI